MFLRGMFYTPPLTNMMSYNKQYFITCLLIFNIYNYKNPNLVRTFRTNFDFSFFVLDTFPDLHIWDSNLFIYLKFSQGPTICIFLYVVHISSSLLGRCLLNPNKGIDMKRQIDAVTMNPSHHAPTQSGLCGVISTLKEDKLQHVTTYT